MSETNCSYCGSGETLDIPDLPKPLCEQCFAYLGMARVRQVTFWEHLWGALRLFLGIVGRESPAGGRMGISLSWEVAWGVHAGTTRKGVPQL